MTCSVPWCSEPDVMTGVCSSHWIESDDAENGIAYIDDELRRIRADTLADSARQAADLERARRLRDLMPDRDRVDRVMRSIVDRFIAESGGDSGRNRALAGAAWAAGRLVAGGEIDRATAMDTLIAAGTGSGLPLRECRYVVGAQFDRARSRPRVLERRTAWSGDWDRRSW